MRQGLARLLRANRGVTALEFAAVAPVFVLFVMGTFACYSLVTARMAIDYGIDRALRYAAVNGGASAPNILGQFQAAAGVLSSDVAANAKLQPAPQAVTIGSTNQPGVRIDVSYLWPAEDSSYGIKLFSGVTITTNGSMIVVPKS